jgi:hypothetical protein
LAVGEQANKKALFFMIEAQGAENRELTEVVFTAADLISGSSEVQAGESIRNTAEYLGGPGQKLEHQESVESRVAVILPILL